MTRKRRSATGTPGFHLSNPEITLRSTLEEGAAGRRVRNVRRRGMEGAAGVWFWFQDALEKEYVLPV